MLANAPSRLGKVGLATDSVKRIISAAMSKFVERYVTAISTAYGPTWHMIRTMEAAD
jgi:hypothetical protein